MKKNKNLYERINKTNYFENIKNNFKDSQEKINKEWDNKTPKPYYSFYTSQRICEIIKKTNLLLQCDNLPNNKIKIFEVISLIKEEYSTSLEDIDNIIFEKINEILILSSLVFNKNELERITISFNNIYYNFIKNLILKKEIEVINKIVNSYFLVKLEILYEKNNFNIFNSNDKNIFLEILTKIPIEQLDVSILNLALLFNSINIFKLDRFTLFYISKQIMKISKEEYSFDEYSDAVYIYEKNRCEYTFSRKCLDYYCGFGEHPIKILKIFLFTNIFFIIIYLFSYLNNLNIFKLNNINYNNNYLELFINILYFNTTTILTVGYGDIYPLNIYTKLLVMIQQILGFVFTTNFITLFLRKLFRY